MFRDCNLSGRNLKGILKVLRNIIASFSVIVLLFSASITSYSLQKPDIYFVIQLSLTYVTGVLLSTAKHRLPTFWMHSLVVILTAYLLQKDTLPTCLQDGARLSLLRRLHVALLTCRAGYFTDLKLLKSCALYIAVLTAVGYVVEAGCVYLLLRHFGYEEFTSLLLATCVPAPSAEYIAVVRQEVAERVAQRTQVTKGGHGTGRAEYNTDQPDGECTRADELAVNGISVIPLEGSNAENGHEEVVKNSSNDDFASAMPLLTGAGSFTTIATLCIFSAVSTGMIPSVSTSHNETVVEMLESNRIDMVFHGVLGLLASVSYAGVIYLLSWIIGPMELTSIRAFYIFSVGAFSMITLASFFGVAAAIGSTWGALAVGLRWQAAEPETVKILNNFWAAISPLYYVTFTYLTIYYHFSTDITYEEMINVVNIMLISLLALGPKFVSLLVVLYPKKLPYLDKLFVVVGLMSKGTVQTAVCTLVPLKLSNYLMPGRYTEVGMQLQLFILLNYLTVLPVCYIAMKVILHYKFR